METVKLKNMKRILRRVDNISKVDLYDAVIKATNIVHSTAKLLAPTDTGNLRSSIHQNVSETKGKIQGSVYTNVQYAPFVEFGTGIKGNGTYPYKLKSGTLTYRNTPWVYNNGDEFVYTKGQKAQPYMYPALKQNKKYIKALIKENIKSKIEDACKGE